MHKKRQEGEGGKGSANSFLASSDFFYLSGQLAAQLYKPPPPPPLPPSPTWPAANWIVPWCVLFALCKCASHLSFCQASLKRMRPPILHIPGFCQQRRRRRMKSNPGGHRGRGRRSVSRGGVLLASTRLISIRWGYWGGGGDFLHTGKFRKLEEGQFCILPLSGYLTPTEAAVSPILLRPFAVRGLGRCHAPCSAPFGGLGRCSTPFVVHGLGGSGRDGERTAFGFALWSSKWSLNSLSQKRFTAHQDRWKNNCSLN